MKIKISENKIQEIQDLLGTTTKTQTVNFVLTEYIELIKYNNKLINENMCLKLNLQMLKNNRLSTLTV